MLPASTPARVVAPEPPTLFDPRLDPFWDVRPLRLEDMDSTMTSVLFNSDQIKLQRWMASRPPSQLICCATDPAGGEVEYFYRSDTGHVTRSFDPNLLDRGDDYLRRLATERAPRILTRIREE